MIKPETKPNDIRKNLDFSSTNIIDVPKVLNKSKIHGEKPKTSPDTKANTKSISIYTTKNVLLLIN